MRSDQPRHNLAPIFPHACLTWNAGGVMTSRTPYGRAMLLILAAGIGMAPVLQANAQAVPAEQDQEAPAAEATAAPDADDADITGLELDWSQLNVDASTLATGPASKACPSKLHCVRSADVACPMRALRCRSSGSPSACGA